MRTSKVRGHAVHVYSLVMLCPFPYALTKITDPTCTLGFGEPESPPNVWKGMLSNVRTLVSILIDHSYMPNSSHHMISMLAIHRVFQGTQGLMILVSCIVP